MSVPRVATNASVERREPASGVACFPVVPSERGSELAADALELAPGAALDLHDAVHDTLVFVHRGAGTLELDGAAHAIAGAGSLVVPAGAPATLRAARDGCAALRTTLGAETDLHAPIGPADPVVVLDHVEPGTATGARSFQVLHGPHNGSTRGTAFVGYIPPGKAPWHYHLYDEIVWVLRGTGQLHVGQAVEPLTHGSAFRLHPREVHIVENLDPAEELVVLGIFTPAGSPSAAYLTPDVAASYAIAGG
jgi:quercetin dioxygenase-like cupin family protein